MKHADHDAHRAFEDSAYAGCHGISCNQGRQPCRDRCGAEMSCAELDKLRPLVRRPEPRKPHLPLWTRVKLWWQRWDITGLLQMLGWALLDGALLGITGGAIVAISIRAWREWM